MKAETAFSTEAEMVAAWLEQLERNQRHKRDWTVYAETAGWDLLLVHIDGYQIGIEAKLSLNAKVLAQAIEGSHCYWKPNGPDYRAVLVPRDKCQHHLSAIADAIGIRILKVNRLERGEYCSLGLPDQEHDWSDRWPCWLPAQRCELPDYVPDVSAGHKSPVKLTEWKIKAIRLMILLERRGRVTRADMKALQISPTRWTDRFHGFLSPDPGVGGYVPNGRTPNLRAQHPENYVQIEADFEKWCPPGYKMELGLL